MAEPRDLQMFPALSPAQVKIAARFSGTPAQRFGAGQSTFSLGARNAPAWLVVEGSLTVFSRAGLAGSAAITTHGPGQFSGEISQLAGRPALAGGRAGPDGCLAIPFDAAELRALVIGSAEIGEIVMRAFILRRVALIDEGSGGPVLIGAPDGAEMVRLRGGGGADPRGAGGQRLAARPPPGENRPAKQKDKARTLRAFGIAASGRQRDFDAVDQGLPLEGLAEEAYGSRRHHAVADAVVRKGGDEDHRRRVAAFAQDLRKLDAADAVHLHVRDQAIDRLGSERGEIFLGRGEGRRLHAERADEAFGGDADGGIIIDDGYGFYVRH